MRRLFISIDWTGIFLLFLRAGWNWELKQQQQPGQQLSRVFSSMSDALHSVCVNVPASLLSENIFATVKKTPSVPYPTHLLCVLLRWGYGLLQVKLWPRGCWQDGVDKSICSSCPAKAAGGARVEDTCNGWRSLYIGTAIWCLYMQLQFSAGIPIRDIYPLVITVCWKKLSRSEYSHWLMWNRCVILWWYLHMQHQMMGLKPSTHKR